ncbi:unknown [Bacteroides cellulosilyticus CAG:158]|nr:unknown [Bacteroides cellulosilyticus CAG:158]
MCGDICHLQRITVQMNITSVRTGRSLHADQGSRSHLSTRHTINGVVDEDDGDILTAVQCMDCFCRTNTCQVTVSLVSEYQSVRPQALDRSGKSGCTSVCGFLPVNIQIVIDEHGTSHGGDTYCFVFHAHFFDYFGYQLVYHTVAASRTVVHGIIVHQSRFLINQILRLDNIFFCHNHFSLSVGEPYKKLHQLNEYCCATNVDEQFEVILCNEIYDDSCQGKYHKEYIQYASYLIRVHFSINFSFSALTISSGSGTIPPRRPKCSTFTLPFTERRTSSTICPAFNSVTSMPFTFSA